MPAGEVAIDFRVRNEVAGHYAIGVHKAKTLARAGDPCRGIWAMARVRLGAEDCALIEVSGLQYGVVVQLAFGREGHDLPPFQAEPAVVEVEVS